jgi:hypothetical protein
VTLVGWDYFIAGRDASNKLWRCQATGDQWTLIGNQGVTTGPVTAAPR